MCAQQFTTIMVIKLGYLILGSYNTFQKSQINNPHSNNLTVVLEM